MLVCAADKRNERISLVACHTHKRRLFYCVIPPSWFWLISCELAEKMFLYTSEFIVISKWSSFPPHTFLSNSGWRLIVVLLVHKTLFQNFCDSSLYLWVMSMAFVFLVRKSKWWIVISSPPALWRLVFFLHSSRNAFSYELLLFSSTLVVSFFFKTSARGWAGRQEETEVDFQKGKKKDLQNN